ncbi:stage II sporulation protein P [Psychrobacillus sp. NEAU-3TGS]|uniref:stage II sporulation protein P n=1 Tax=Psychrobacillus sp. NEAU-3TGS TaxID=2995412 RepID=UPI00249940CF|nr:stage II sporulation protein P [Psychrobacillus sp. NEAU-3TGS]MDI2588176.1 stage II sporulation protein P [Psychrobacillus sp. NEAU-3TGS]
MAKYLKNLTSILILLFLAPIIIATVQTPLFTTQPEQPEQVEEKEKEEIPVVYAAQLEKKPVVQEVVVEPKQAFVYFTHSQEAYQPILAAQGEKIAIYHPINNITTFQDQINAQFAFHQLETTFLENYNKKEMDDYNSIRPLVQQAIGQNNYDIILDIHRDSARAKVTTLKSGEASYAKFIFVIGREHPNYRWNEQLAQNLSNQLNKLVPGISRGILPKEGKGVDGVYNQDLSKNLLNVELGGIDNSEEEINRSIAILAKALSNMLNEQLPS